MGGEFTLPDGLLLYTHTEVTYFKETLEETTIIDDGTIGDALNFLSSLRATLASSGDDKLVAIPPEEHFTKLAEPLNTKHSRQWNLNRMTFSRTPRANPLYPTLWQITGAHALTIPISRFIHCRIHKVTCCYQIPFQV